MTTVTGIHSTTGPRATVRPREILYWGHTLDGTEPTSQEELFGLDPISGTVRRITDDRGAPNGYGYSDRDPDWSPRRTRIVSMRSDGQGLPHLSVRAADGTPILTLPVAGTEPVWMTERRVLCCLDRGVAAVGIPGGAVHPVLRAGHGERFGAPAWHPTAGLVAVLTTDAHPHGSALVHATAAQVRAAVTTGSALTTAALTWLTGTAHWVDQPDWSPDGSHVAFSTDRPCATVEDGRVLHQGEIAVIGIQPPHVVELVTDDSAGQYADGLDDRSPVFSPDGTRLVWARGYEDSWARLMVQRIGAPHSRRVLLADTHWFKSGLDW